VAIIGAGVSSGAAIGELIGGLAYFTNNTGAITTGSPNVFINGRPAARASLSTVLCDKHGPALVAEGSRSVYINGMPVSRVGDHTTCGGKINAGSSNVFIGGETEATEDIESEVPAWLNMAMTGLGLVSVYGLLRFGVISLGRLGLGMAGGAGSEFGGHWAGGKVFGEGSDGQKVTALLSGAIIGGLTAWRGGTWLRGGGRWLNARRLPSQDRLNNAKAVKDLEANILPGTPNKGPSSPINMHPSKDPSKTAEDFAVRLFGGEKINKKPLPNGIDGWTAQKKDGTWVTYRPAGEASYRTPQDMASVDVNGAYIKAINEANGRVGAKLKLKFPSL